ncbi:MAG TPA: hypothetical protein VEK55_02710 [Xanthobacteraceae bacterium]|nr:hypothetical protein [Xanthobacteraceae bacterium]
MRRSGATGLYKERVRGRAAATGGLMVESELFEPISPITAVTPGFYDPTDKGFAILQTKH